MAQARAHHGLVAQPRGAQRRRPGRDHDDRPHGRGRGVRRRRASTAATRSTPEQFGLARAPSSTNCAAATPPRTPRIMREVLDGAPGPRLRHRAAERRRGAVHRRGGGRHHARAWSRRARPWPAARPPASSRPWSSVADRLRAEVADRDSTTMAAQALGGVGLARRERQLARRDARRGARATGRGGAAARPPAAALAAAIVAGRWRRQARPAARLALIAEVKRASPSKGALRPDLDAAAQARPTPPPGPTPSRCSPSRAASAARWPTSKPSPPPCALPVLRKDFIVDASQVWEAARRAPPPSC